MSLTKLTSSQVLYKHSSTATTQTLSSKLRERVSVLDYGADPTGVSDSTAALMAAAAALPDGAVLDFCSGTYLISYTGTAYSSVYGNVVMDFINKSDIQLLGGCTKIVVVDHDIAANGGLRFANFSGCKNVSISGISFEMSYVGANSSSEHYPFCGAITFIDPDDVSPDFTTLNSDVVIENCDFLLYHPWGTFTTTPTPYLGDSNNGYKLFSIFVSGPYTPTSYANQCRTISINNCTFKKGHNGYGIWFWAWNNCSVNGCIAEAWVTKYSTNTGTYVSGATLPMIRYIPFKTEGIVVENCQFRALPTEERISGFEGNAVFCMLANNLGDIDHSKGLSIVANNNIVLGTGSLDDVTSTDTGVFFNIFGQFIFTNNNIDGHMSQDPTAGAGVIALQLEPGYNGVAEISICNNNFGPWNFGNIYFSNGSNASADTRRCKSLTINNNIFSSGDSFVRMYSYSPKTYEGCKNTIISNNIIQSQNAGANPPPSTDNYGLDIAASDASDSVLIYGNIIRDKTYAIIVRPARVHASAKLRRFDNQLINITTPYQVGITDTFDKTSAVEIVAESADGANMPSRIRCVNTQSTPVEVQLYQQADWSYLIATNRIKVYTGGNDQTSTDTNEFRPSVDNTKNLGTGDFRWANVYAGNGSIITTSDEREKQQIQDIDSAVLRAWGKVKFFQYKFNQAVNNKGLSARWHFGVIAQRVKEAFESEGLDAFSYGLLCYDEWNDRFETVLEEVEEQQEDGSVIKIMKESVVPQLIMPAGNRYSIRYEEALALECAYLRSQLVS